MNNTPETDALVPQFLNGGEIPDIFALCRQLERERTKELRSVTPMGFARAFFAANSWGAMAPAATLEPGETRFSFYSQNAKGDSQPPKKD